VRQKDISQIRIVGGHLALDFVNTVDARRDRWGPDALCGFDDVVRWAQRVSLISADEADRLFQLAQLHMEDAKRAFEHALTARELIYRLFLAEARGDEPAQEDIAGFTPLSRASNSARLLTFDGKGYDWRWRPDELDTILHRVVFAAAELLVDQSRRQVRECTGLNCGWLFLDHSKGGRRTWCSDEGCGTRERVRRKRLADKAG
jgi:predicted RNA-binding Zn ribbon-like protein